MSAECRRRARRPPGRGDEPQVVRAAGRVSTKASARKPARSSASRMLPGSLWPRSARASRRGMCPSSRPRSPKQTRYEQGRSSSRSPKGGVDDGRREPEYRSLAKTLRPTEGAEIAVGAAMMRTSTRRSRCRPPVARCGCRARAIAGRQLARQLADLVEEQDAPLRAFERARVIACAPEGGAALMAEQLASTRFGGTAPQSKTRTRAGARTDAVNHVRKHVLPVPVSREGQRHLGRRELADQRVHLPHAAETAERNHRRQAALRSSEQRRRVSCARRSTRVVGIPGAKVDSQRCCLHQPALIPAGFRANVTFRNGLFRPAFCGGALATRSHPAASMGPGRGVAWIREPIAGCLFTNICNAKGEQTLVHREVAAGTQGSRQ